MKYAAFGEMKTVAQWAADVRCWVTHAELKRRISDGWPFEMAIRIPTSFAADVHTAFGETKTLASWMSDPRYIADPRRLVLGLREGKPLETMLRPRSPGEPAPEPKAPKSIELILAFGDEKTAKQWAKDPRCSCGPGALTKRIRGGLSPEDAMSLGPQSLGVAYKAFGEYKSLMMWLCDPRRAAPVTLVQARLAAYESMWSALTRPETEGVGQSRLVSRIGQISQEDLPMLTLFGETKSLRDWRLDPRCEVSLLTLRSRMLSTWPRDESIILRLGIKNKDEGRYTAHSSTGEILGKFPKFQLAVEAIKRAGGIGAVEDGVHGNKTPIPRWSLRQVPPAQSLTAWGETKTIKEWTRDQRCVVTGSVLRLRLVSRHRAWTPEEAISEPTVTHRSRRPLWPA